MATRKELINEYKQMKFPMGVFQIKNLANGKIFIDNSVNLNAIWNRHRAQLSFGSHPNAGLQADWRTFGETEFVFEILSELPHDENGATDYQKELKVLMELYMEALAPFQERGYHDRPK